MTQSARVSHSLLDPYLTTPLRNFYPALRLPLALPPEAIVLCGHAFAIAGAICFAFVLQSPLLGLVAGLCVVGHHLCDVFDGQHARATGQCRHGGELLDHFLDPLSISYFVIAWAFAAGQLNLAIPGVLIVMATAVLTNLKAKLGAAFELPAFGPTEFKTLLAIVPVVVATAISFEFDHVALVLWSTLATVTGLAAICFPFQLVEAVRAVNQSPVEVDTTEWVHGDKNVAA